MKLGLLLALAVAAFVPHLSESRIISRCELKQKLQQALTVTKTNKRNYDQIIALVSCEVEMRSHLDSSLVMGNAVRPPPAVTPNAGADVGNQTITEGGTSSTTSAAAVSTANPAYSTAGSLRRKREARFEEKHNGKWSRKDDEDDNSSEDEDSNDNSSEDEDSNDNSSEDEDSNDNSSEDEDNIEESDEIKGGKVGNGSQEKVTQAAMIPTATAAVDTTGMSNSTVGSLRRKRDAPSRKGHKKRGKKEKKKGDGSSEENHAGKQSQESSSLGESHEKVTDGGMGSTTGRPTTAASFSSTGTAAVSDSTPPVFRIKREARFRRSPDRREGKDERSEQEERKEKKSGKGGKHSHESSEVGSHQQGTVKPTPNAASVPATASASATASAAMPTGTARVLKRRRRASFMEKKKDNEKEDKSKESHEFPSQEDHSNKPHNGSISFYGLFQLSNNLCDSGNSGSKSECGKKCSAFIDDDITDDIECFVDSGSWRPILNEISSVCFKQMDTYFDACQ